MTSIEMARAWLRAGTGVALAVAAACTAGCMTVGADFVAPPAPDAPAYRHAAQGSSNPAAALPYRWWTLFGDDRLTQLEEQALRDSPNLKASAARLLQAQAQLAVAGAAKLPAVSVDASAQNLRTSATTPLALAFGGRSVSGNQFEVNASLSYELDIWGRVRRMVESAGAQALAAASDRDAVALLLSTQVATTYWQLRGLEVEQDLLLRAVASRREYEQLAGTRFQAGLMSELDATRAQVELHNSETELHAVQRQRFTLQHALAVLAGASPSLPWADGLPAALPAPPPVPVGLPATLLGQRPDLAASVALLRSANADVGVAEGALYPRLELTGSFGFASESLRHLSEGHSRVFSIGPLVLSLPLLDGGRSRAYVALSQARHAEALANHESRLLTALREVEDALSDREELQRQSESQAQAQAAVGRLHEVAVARYRLGLTSYFEVVDAQRAALAADRAAAQIHTQRLLASVSLVRALGGGWSPPGAAVARADAAP